MSFAKRGTGEGHPARNLLPPIPVNETAAPATARMKVANAGGIDKSFIALAVGVVLVSAGGAIAAPSFLDMFGTRVRPIKIVVADLDRDQAKAALAKEAFPDGEGRALLSSLKTHFPGDHDHLLNVLADEAMSGGDRDDLMEELGRWSVEFVVPNLPAIGRTGAEGFDEMLNIGGGALQLIEKTAGCTAEKLEAFVSNPTNLANSMTYGSEGYRFSMQTSAKLVNLAAKGRNAPPAPTEFRREDEKAVTSAFLGMMMDEQIMGLMAASSNPEFDRSAAEFRKIDVCKIARTFIDKMRNLPQGTKERMLAMGTQGLPPGAMQQLMSGGAAP